MKPRFLADHDLNEAIVSGVRRVEPGIEFRHARDLSLEQVPDDEILAFAAREGLLVVSHDVNTMTATAYARIAAGEVIAGLLLVPQVLPVSTAIDDLVLIWIASEMEEWRDQVWFVPL